MERKTRPTNVWLSDLEKEKLEKFSKVLGVSQAEVIRKLLGMVEIENLPEFTPRWVIRQ